MYSYGVYILRIGSSNLLKDLIIPSGRSKIWFYEILKHRDCEPSQGHRFFGRTNPNDDAESWLGIPRSGIWGMRKTHHSRLVGQPVTLSRTPSRLAAKPPEYVDDFANCNSDSD